jgi:hypothetical protein
VTQTVASQRSMSDVDATMKRDRARCVRFAHLHQRVIDTMAVFKSSVDVHDSGRRSIGAGMAYVHLRLGTDVEQRATGTVSLRRWEPEGEAPAWLELADGRRLQIDVSREVLSECSRNHILRFQTDWPPAIVSPSNL